MSSLCRSREIMAKLESIIDSYKSEAEKRVKFLMPITPELQKVAKVFSRIISKIKI